MYNSITGTQHSLSSRDQQSLSTDTKNLKSIQYRLVHISLDPAVYIVQTFSLSVKDQYIQYRSSVYPYLKLITEVHLYLTYTTNISRSGGCKMLQISTFSIKLQCIPKTYLQCTFSTCNKRSAEVGGVKYFNVLFTTFSHPLKPPSPQKI